MKLANISFTRQGKRLGQDLCQQLDRQENTCCHYGYEQYPVEGMVAFSKVYSLVATLFKEVDMLLYIGATGIAVRSIAPHLQSKATDPAVLVMGKCSEHVL